MTRPQVEHFEVAIGALRMLHEREEAAEATQEIFLLAFQNIPRFRGRSRFSTWLYRIAVNCCISRIRRRPPEAPLSLEDDKLDAGRLQAAGTQVEELIRVERNRRISEALAQLTPEQRVVVELRFYQGMTFDEIGRVLAVSPSTVKSRLYAGLEILKIRLAGEE